MAISPSNEFTFRSQNRILSMQTPQVWGVVNLTDDSFYAESRKNELNSAFAQAEKHLEEGASVIDIGAMSSRPGAQVSESKNELKRLLPLIDKLKDKYPDCWLSIDTIHADVAEECIKRGADIINDISGGKYDERMLRVIADKDVPCVLMHMRGTPENMQSKLEYDDLVRELMLYFKERIRECKNFDISDVILDPGFGFSKNAMQNMKILDNIKTFKIYDLPVLIGLSRKSTIYETLDISPDGAMNGTTALHMTALMNGSNILRVHDVKEAIEVCKLYKFYKNSIE